MAKKTSPPSIKKTAFDCPHCGAFTTQYWFNLHAEELEDGEPLPRFPYKGFKGRVQEDEKMSVEKKKF